MQVGVFVPINNNGWLISENAPQYHPSFDLNKQIAQSAEKYGLDFLLSMIKLRGFGGKTQFWEYGLESFTLMAGLAAVTEKIKIYATCPTLVIPPAFAARMCSTIDSISHGRFGLNLITGWQPPEYTQMGVWPGDEHFRNRYQMLDEYAHILRELWANGVSDFKGDYYRMEDCRVRPQPQGDMKIICAGSSDAGLAFSAKWADYAFCLGKGVNTPTAFSFNNDRLAKALEATGRDVQVFVLVMIIAAETDEEAMAKWKSYNDGVDLDAIAWLAEQGAKDKVNTDTNVRQLAAPEGAVNINMGTLVGSYASVAEMLDEMALVPNTGGVLLTFDDFVEGVEAFGTRIQPLMKSRGQVQV
ncbi:MULTISPECIES: pyrimidine utilization protein A [unclassified Novosphingobium]|uniref:pyrimidine utilization protein A n=1 Tax=unclassified Novosphingobium TaxID=2644732 RepID=UPI00086F7A76|nr:MULTISPECIES: pyrimidine utilization protein A [unclassified Novosphingobium]MDR6708797.1 pyrimidine oxygenase [Novosphingobium sp. 1748]ODU82892.1 MAG: pyrimidine utilization protein A [Novosphingobium sp. SCN 63-17]OJX96595.1 MAG: pyrimidine utilization protein A [Novosphingobium sp. 63-713]